MRVYASPPRGSVQRARGNIALFGVVGRLGPGGEGRGARRGLAFSAWVAGRVTGPRPAGPRGPQLRSLEEFSGQSPPPHPVPPVSSPRYAHCALVTQVWGGSREEARVKPSQAVGSRRLPGRSSQAWAAGGAAAGPSPKHFRRAASAGQAGLGRGDPARVRAPRSCTRRRGAGSQGSPEGGLLAAPGRAAAGPGRASEAGRGERVCGGRAREREPPAREGWVGERRRRRRRQEERAGNLEVGPAGGPEPRGGGRSAEGGDGAAGGRGLAGRGQGAGRWDLGKIRVCSQGARAGVREGRGT